MLLLSIAPDLVVRALKSVLRLIGDRRGSVTITTALILPCVLGFIALAVEFGQVLLTKVQNQRVADAAAYAAALAYSSTNSTATMLSVAQSIAALNGLASTTVSASLVTSSPRTSTNSAIKATITTSQDMLLAPVLNFGSSISISAVAYAEIPAGTPACVLALSSSGAGITLSGGTTVTASSCSIASNTTEAVPCGTSITAQNIYYGTTAPSVGCTGGITGTITKATTAGSIQMQCGEWRNHFSKGFCTTMILDSFYYIAV